MFFGTGTFKTELVAIIFFKLGNLAFLNVCFVKWRLLTAHNWLACTRQMLVM